MCGIAGFLSRGGKHGPKELGEIVATMTSALRHRGPDGDGTWIDPAAGPAQAAIAFGHRRLAIIDVTPSGRQPMVSADDRFVITFNGEIYNFRELRAELEAAGSRFRGHSDTEVLIEGCSTWGIERLVPRLIGIFAFAVWDRHLTRLTLVRDQVGVKPLYWGQFDDLTLFGSELKALTAHPGCPAAIDRDSVACFMRFGYVPTPFSIYRGIHKLPPGSLLHIVPGHEPELSIYWDAREVAVSGIAGRDAWTEHEALERLEQLLIDAVGRQMIADVPLGAFLSGGIDSSLVTALAQASSDRQVRTFSIGFTEPEYDEAPFARTIAKHLGTDHTELYLGSSQLLDTVPRLAHFFDEPFADASQLATLVLSEMTRKHVTVALSGDGGDELFAGYSHHHLLGRLWRQASRMPHAAQKAVAWSVLNLPGWVYSSVRTLSTERPGQVPWPDRVVRTAQLLPAFEPDDLYRRRYSHWSDPALLLTGSQEHRGSFWEDNTDVLPDFIDRMQYLDQVTYMADDVLPKVDRASMAVGLEARVPLLDHRVVEFAWSLPQSMKLRDGTGKWALRQVLDKYVPRKLFDRPKNGFNPPVDFWMRGPLRGWAENLIDPARLRAEGFLAPERIRPVWDAFQRGAGRPWDHKLLWDVLMFQAWLDEHHTDHAAVSPPIPLSAAG